MYGLEYLRFVFLAETCSLAVEGCIGFGLPRNPWEPMQNWQEWAVLPLLRAGVGGQKVLRETRGEWWDLAYIRNGVEKKIKAAVYFI